MQNPIAIKKTANASAYLSCLAQDVDEEFFTYAQQNDEDMYAISFAGTTVGLAQAVADRYAFLYVYIFPTYRRRGFGKAAVSFLEDLLRNSGAEKIQTCYRCSDSASEIMAAHYGYWAQYSSVCMAFSGNPWALPNLPIRAYHPSDFIQAHNMTAEAFHFMRLQTGCFPDSVVAQPDAKTECYWKKTAPQRFVYTKGSEVIGMVHLEGREIGSVAVKRALQGNGIGTQLVKFAVNRLLSEGNQNVSLYCVVGNPAYHLYQKLGFQEQFRNTYAEKEA